MRRFLIGMVMGALLMHIYLQYGMGWYVSFRNWITSAASDYRGDKDHQRAKEVLR